METRSECAVDTSSVVGANGRRQSLSQCVFVLPVLLVLGLALGACRSPPLQETDRVDSGAAIVGRAASSPKAKNAHGRAQGASAVKSGSTEGADASGYALRPDTLIRLHRTECYGPCPVYTVAIRGDGRVFFYGNAHTQTLGYATSRIDPKAVAALLEFMRTRRYLSLPRRYVGRATDFPSAVSMLHQARVSHQVDRDLSHDVPALGEIELEIDRIAGSARWVGPRRAHEGDSYVRPPSLTAEQARDMLGDELERSLDKCAAGKRVRIELTFAIDREGRVTTTWLSGWRDIEASLDCVKEALRRVDPPLVDIYDIEPVELSIGP
jgi:hypothetical protein